MHRLCPVIQGAISQGAIGCEQQEEECDKKSDFEHHREILCKYGTRRPLASHAAPNAELSGPFQRVRSNDLLALLRRLHPFIKAPNLFVQFTYLFCNVWPSYVLDPVI
jgi:hypothetical protein